MKSPTRQQYCKVETIIWDSHSQKSQLQPSALSQIQRDLGPLLFFNFNIRSYPATNSSHTLHNNRNGNAITLMIIDKNTIGTPQNTVQNIAIKCLFTLLLQVMLGFLSMILFIWRLKGGYLTTHHTKTFICFFLLYLQGLGGYCDTYNDTYSDTLSRCDKMTINKRARSYF